ncbi:hypothetical protein [Roseovarius albus]|nr:hypothetical protein [Roseovarius albus]
MNHGELRTKVYDHFKGILEKAKARRNELGPYTGAEKELLVNTIQVYEMDNEDFWDLMKKDFATQQFQSFCSATGVPQEQPRETLWAILDEIRKATIGLNKALLEHDKTFEKYDFDATLSAPWSHPEWARPDPGLNPTEVARGPSETASGPLLSVLFEQRKNEAEQTGQWTLKLVNDYQVWTDLLIELQGDRPCPSPEFLEPMWA